MIKTLDGGVKLAVRLQNGTKAAALLTAGDLAKIAGAVDSGKSAR